MTEHGILAKYFLVLAIVLECHATVTTPPNIVLIVVDDLGWDDIGFHNQQVKTPHLDKLAREGIILRQSYVQAVCSPSRAALMTGTYPYRLGFQHSVLYERQRVCVPLNKAFLPQVLKTKGYATHMVGKWHLGFCDLKCTPTYRGFDTFYGFYTAMEDYYTKDIGGGYDFRDGLNVDYSANGTYSTYLYTNRTKQIIENHDVSNPLFLYLAYQNAHDPLQVPENYLDPKEHADDRKRHNALAAAMDDSVGEVIKSLVSKGIYDNTLIVVTADNGGAVQWASSNYPLRGGKASIFEGGTRAVSFVHGPMLNTSGAKYDGFIHIVDWFPTLAEVAGANYSEYDIDGVNQWQSLLSLATPSARQEVLYNLDLSDDPEIGRAAIRVGDYKLVAGFPGLYQEWYPPPEATGVHVEEDRAKVQSSFDWVQSVKKNRGLVGASSRLPARLNATASKYYYLFNLKDDPAERHNLYDPQLDIVKHLQARLDAHKARYVTPSFPMEVPEGDPTRYGGVWTPGWCPDIQ